MSYIKIETQTRNSSYLLTGRDEAQATSEKLAQIQKVMDAILEDPQGPQKLADAYGVSVPDGEALYNIVVAANAAMSESAAINSFIVDIGL